MNKKKICVACICALVAIFLIVMGPADYFSHGFYADEIDISQVAEEDLAGVYDLGVSDYSMEFSPVEKHFAGFEIFLVNKPKKATGKLSVTVKDSFDRVLDVIDIDLSKVKNSSWYKVYTKTKLKQGETYKLNFSASDCDGFPALQAIDKAFLKPETISGDIIISYAYSKSTFSFQEKILFLIIALALAAFLLSIVTADEKKKVYVTAAIFLLMVSTMSWNYMYNSMNKQNTVFDGFQEDSEALVASVIYAEENGLGFLDEDERGYGLGRYFTLHGGLMSYDDSFITDENWLDGYSRFAGAFIVNSTFFSKSLAKVDNYVLFKNGDIFKINNVEDDGFYLTVFLDTDKILKPAKNGSLDEVQFFDSEMQPLDNGRIRAYRSQYGIQGKIFRHIARYLDKEDEINTLNLLCCILAAVAFALIVFLINAKYNPVMAGCYFTVFLLSPWIVNFAKNLYWIEFIWFVPMLAGLFCSINIENKKCRLAAYVVAFFSILFKCLCGYEFISTIMMGLIGFLLVDLVKEYFEKDYKKCILLLRTTIIIGVLALAGFMMAICIHGMLRGNGNLISGIKTIFVQDVLRRTAGADLNDFEEILWPSFNASVWETFSLYFHFNTEIITGIAGNLFSVLCIVPICIFIYDYLKKNIHIEEVTMYVVFFLSAVSWFSMAKGHSFIHTHMNFVLWYFGFIQICLYIIIKRFIDFIKTNRVQ